MLKSILIFIFILSPILTLNGEDKKSEDGLGDEKKYENYDNRSEKAVKDIEGDHKKIDVIDPRNKTTDIEKDKKDVQDINNKDEEKDGETVDLDKLLPKGIGEKGGGDHVVKNDPNEDKVKNFNKDKKDIKTNDPRNKTSDIYNDKKNVQNINLAFGGVDISGKVGVRVVNNEQDGDISYTFQGIFELTASKSYKNTKLQLTLGTLDPYYTNSRWSDLRNDSSKGGIDDHPFGVVELYGSYFGKNYEIAIGRKKITDFYKKAQYFFSPYLMIDGLHFNISNIKNMIDIKGFSSLVEKEDQFNDKDFIIFSGLQTSFNFDSFTIALNYFWLHGDNIVNKFGALSKVEESLDGFKIQTNSDFKKDNHYLTLFLGYEIIFPCKDTLSLYLNGGINFMADDDKFGAQFGAKYDSKNRGFYTGIEYSYKQRDSVISVYAHPVYATASNGGKLFFGKYIGEKASIEIQSYLIDTNIESDDDKWLSTTRLIYSIKF